MSWSPEPAPADALRPRREAICLGCREKLCCFHYAVGVTAADIWRIARALQLAPADFLAYREADPPGASSFVLEPGGSAYDLCLAKRRLPDPMPEPCVFLVRTNDDHGVCGLGELRPAQCRSYPVQLRGDVVALIDDPEGCVRSWSYADLDRDEGARVRALIAEDDAYREQVREWNRRVLADGRPRSFGQFCDWLLNREAGP